MANLKYALLNPAKFAPRRIPECYPADAVHPVADAANAVMKRWNWSMDSVLLSFICDRDAESIAEWAEEFRYEMPGPDWPAVTCSEIADLLSALAEAIESAPFDAEAIWIDFANAYSVVVKMPRGETTRWLSTDGERWTTLPGGAIVDCPQFDFSRIKFIRGPRDGERYTGFLLERKNDEAKAKH